MSKTRNQCQYEKCGEPWKKEYEGKGYCIPHYKEKSRTQRWSRKTVMIICAVASIVTIFVGIISVSLPKG